MLLKTFLLALSLTFSVCARPDITPAAALKLAARVASFTGVSITPVSIEAVSIITPTSVRTDSTSTSKSTHYGPTPTCTQTIKPDKNGYVPPNTCGALYNYYPSFGAAIVFAVLFGGVMTAHITQAAIYKKKFCWVVCMGATWEFGSFATRAVSTRHQQSSGLATVAQLLVLLAPLWVNAFDYMVLGRMINYFHPNKRIWKIAPSSLAFVFVSLDITSFIIQLIGGGMAGPGSSPSAQKTGIHIYEGGIGLQEAFIVMFLGLAVKFHLEMLAAEKKGLLAGDKTKWRRLLYALYASLIAITVRIIFRLSEFSRGFTMSNPVPYHEAYFYVLDGLPMFIAILIWNIFHPGTILQGPDSELPRSWLSRKLCCCCKGRDKARGAHEIIKDNDFDEEMNPLRSRDPSPYRANGDQNKTPLRYGDTFVPPSRDPSPYRGDGSRDPSPYRGEEEHGRSPPQYDPTFPKAPTHARPPSYGQNLYPGSNA